MSPVSLPASAQHAKEDDEKKREKCKDEFIEDLRKRIKVLDLRKQNEQLQEKQKKEKG